MLAKLLGVGPEDRRDTGVAFGTLVAILAAHSVLETARDALFLGELPPEHLPLAYIAIAGLALVVSKLNQSATARYPRRALLAVCLAGGGLVTAAFYPLTASRGGLELGALYVWTGLLATIVVVQFWLQVGDVLDVGRAKRLFSLIASGGLVGATAGSAAAGALLTILEPRDLLLVAGGLFVAAAGLPLCLRGAPAERPRRHRQPRAPRSDLGEVASNPYLRRLFFVVLVGAVLATGIDFAFKSAVVDAAAARGLDLGIFFARYYAVINGLALVVQILIAPRLLRAMGVNRALLVMPALMLAGAVGLAATLTLIPALVLKGADGTLRHSVHRTAIEILYLPLPRRVRERFKGFAESVGRRGGQALASLAILGSTTVTDDPRVVATGLAVLAGIWVLTMVGMQPHYLELFRKQLREGALDTDVDIPNLDLASFEALVAALSSENDQEVIAALDMFEIYGKTELVPALILYHPSREVVSRAFSLFSRTERADVRRLTARLLGHEDDELRAAALRTYSSVGADEETLRSFLDDDSPAVRCTALCALVSNGHASFDEVSTELLEAARSEHATVAVALARAMRQLPDPQFAALADEMAAQTEPEVLAELAGALASHPRPRYLPTLVSLLARRESRPAAREALVALGKPALEHLATALRHGSHPPEVRLHLPRTISRFPGPEPVAILAEALPGERDRRVAFKILRGLGRLRAERPQVGIDRAAMIEQAERMLQRAITILHWQLTVRRLVPHQQGMTTPAAEMLVAFLEEREKDSIARLFRILHIIEPTEEFRMILTALRGEDEKAKAGSRELLSHVVPPALRDGILAMVDEAPPPERLRNARAFYDPPDRKRIEAVFRRMEEAGGPQTQSELCHVYAGTLREMLSEPSNALRAIVHYHVSELCLEELSDIIADAASGGDVLGEIASHPAEAGHAG